ncbi:Glycosyltransferase involved in cell wall bisynthesis [Mucilaginibacter mallensis]|uniref:Glycosyltransferase involved in cell wall bisynthesis n=1 Tax=Mucilaginibacter mallensis TaxID=652787 RepID=A0A1H1WRQ2_MUCMA|nr:glycosyltransferase family 1 protein [Mucilaginibacter mallensis]SDS99813.1 Glycosyltransferase involved in cell wall bisynthesis [Mucilaginibacter mallensis]
MHKNREDKVKLGIDAKWFFEGPPSGHMVVKNLVDEMIINNNGRFEIFLLLNAKNKQQAQAYFPADVRLIFLFWMPNILSNLLLIPLMTRLYGIKIMLFQNFSSIWPQQLFKIVYIHDVLFLDHPQYYSRLEKLHFRQMKHLAGRANGIITISNTEKERMVKNQVGAADDIAVVYHGIHKSFKPLTHQPADRIQEVINKYDLPEKYLLYVGRVNSRKNINNLIRALSLLEDNDLKLLITGEQCHNSTDLEELIHTRHLADRVIFTGHVPENDLHLIYAIATVFCFPSYAEGFGLPPLEAMQCGVPVVVSNRTSVPEICGDAATYIDPDDPADIAKKINTLLNDSCLYEEKMMAGIRHAAKFSWQQSANEILDLISYAYVDRKSYKEA